VIRHGGHFLIAFVGLVDMAVALSAAFAGASASGFRIDGLRVRTDTRCAQKACRRAPVVEDQQIGLGEFRRQPRQHATAGGRQVPLFQ